MPSQLPLEGGQNAAPPKSFNGMIVPQDILQFAKEFVEKNGKDSIPLLIEKHEQSICKMLGIQGEEATQAQP